MNKLLIILFALQSFSVWAGVILDRKTGDELSLELLEDAQVVQAQTNFEYKEIPLKKVPSREGIYSPGYQSDSFARSILPETTTNITNHDGVCSTEMWHTMSGKRKLGRVGEVIFLTPVNLVIDLVTLPGRLNEQAQFRKDRRIIRKAIEKDKTFKVSTKRYKRIKSLLGIE